MNRHALMLLVMNLLAVLCMGERERDSAITTITASPGLYYERLHSIRLKRTEWRVVVFMEIDKLLSQMPDWTQYNEDYQKCHLQGQMNDTCDHAFRLDYLEPKFKRAREVGSELRNVVNDFGGNSKEPALRTMKKRDVPFGFIGSASRFLFGTLTKEDAEAITAEITAVKQTQGQLIRIMRNQTHIMANNLQHLHAQAKVHETRIASNREKINELIKWVNGILAKENIQDYVTAAVHYASCLGDSLDHWIEAGEKYIAAIGSAREKKIHQSLLSGAQLSGVIAEIEQVSGKYELPIPRRHRRMEEISKIAAVEMGHFEGRLLMTLELPLVERTGYHLYQLHTWPAPQLLGEEGKGISARVIPRTDFMGLSDDHRSYFLATSHYLKRCIETWYCYLCPAEVPLQDVTGDKSCEIGMLLNPEIEALRDCEIRISSTHDSFWTRLTSIGAWLYSLQQTEKLQVVCEGKQDDLITISGTGILQLKTGCMAKTSYVTLTGVQIMYGREQYLYQPELALNITAVSPAMNLHAVIGYLGKGTPTSKGKVEKPLREVEESLLKLEEQNQTHQTHFIMSYGGYSVQTILILLVLAYCMRKPIAKICKGRGYKFPGVVKGSTSENEETEIGSIPSRALPAQVAFTS